MMKARSTSARVVLRYAKPRHLANSTSNAFFDSVHVEGLNALTQDGRGAVSFVLPKFYELDRTLGITGRDDAQAVLAVPEWSLGAWLRQGACTAALF